MMSDTVDTRPVPTLRVTPEKVRRRWARLRKTLKNMKAAYYVKKADLKRALEALQAKCDHPCVTNGQCEDCGKRIQHENH